MKKNNIHIKKNIMSKVLRLSTIAILTVVVFFLTDNTTKAQDLSLVPETTVETPVVPNVPVTPAVTLDPNAAALLQQNEMTNLQQQPASSTNNNEKKQKNEKQIEDEYDEDEQVFSEDKEAYVEDNKRVYPKWQSARKKPVKEYNYSIKVNKTTNTVTVYIKEDNGKLTPYKAMVCSVGREGHDTPEGKGYHTSDYYDWRLMVDNTYGRYAVRFNGSIMFHSVPYYESKKNTLEWKDYNKLGGPASLGCIRLAVADAKWIFDNCKRGTEVEVYSGPASTDPLGTPTPIKLDLTSEYRDWDPTDLNVDNPWLETIE